MKMSLEEFRRKLPKEYQNYPNDKLKNVLNLLYRMAAICLEIARKKQKKNGKDCNPKPDEYNVNDSS